MDIIILRMNPNQSHVNAHSLETNIKTTVNFYCNRGNCRKGFDRSGKLELHHRMHDNHLIKCYFCPWGGVAHWDFFIHMNHHFHVRPFKCSYCPDAFYKSNARKCHEESSHEKIIDKYKCNACDHSTYNLVMLHYHKQKMHHVK